MNLSEAVTSGAASKDLAELIHTLVEAERSIREITAGEVDAVTDDQGRVFLLQHAQESLRYRESLRHEAILNALPASIALLDSQGVIVATNETWRRFALHNGAPQHSPGPYIGVNYLSVCDSADGEDSEESHDAATGIRSVLSGQRRAFSLEYPCHAPDQQRWFLMTATPLDDKTALGAIVMHVDITARKLAEIALEASVEEFRSLAESVPQIVWTTRADGWNTYFNQQWMDYTGLTLKESHGHGWSKPFHPDDQQRAWDAWQDAVNRKGGYSLECRLRRSDGVYRWWLVRGAPVRDEHGKILKWFGTCTDIHDLKESKLAIERAAALLEASATRVRYLNRVHSMLSGINQLIVRVSDRSELFRRACQIAVDLGGFQAAALVLVDRASGRIVPVATAGSDPSLLAAISTVVMPHGEGSTMLKSLAIREKKPVVSNHAPTDERLFLRKEYARAQVGSVAAFPLIVAEEAIGALVLCARENEFFHGEEMELLVEVSGDIAFAVDHIGKSEKLEYLALYDALTGLPNRGRFVDRVQQDMRTAAGSGGQLVVGIVNLNRFKNVNDTLGRAAGDALLVQVGHWLTQRAGDAAYLARLEADRFALVLPSARPDGNVSHLIAKWIDALASHVFGLDSDPIRISATVGAALFPDDGDQADVLLQCAEAALRKAKSNGDPYLFFDREMNKGASARLSLEYKLRRAIDREEFVLHYQPKVDITSGKVVGAEALIRWNDPETGLVPPGMFIPLLEETGLIHRVGHWALCKAVSDYLHWLDAGLPAVRIAVNVSSLQLRDRGFVSEIEQIVSIDSRAAAGLELEITESMIMEDIKHSIASLKAIRSSGITVAVDDFGTGFSSLSYVTRLPIDTLKIDRSFIVEMTAGPDGLALVTTIINLARSLNFKAVAEGVETDEQLRLLRLLRCDQMQGYLFSKPVPGDVFEAKFLAPVATG